MTYLKLTYAQQKNQDRVEAWLKQEPFKENSRAKPAIPELTIEDVMEQYIPHSVRDTGAFFTPADMVWQLYSYAHINQDGTKVLDPCAGIGNLLYPLQECRELKIEVHAWELAISNYEVGAKLFPDFHWKQCNAYEQIANQQGMFDVVFVNPPFNIQWATSTYESQLVSGATKSEHMMLEVALRALKPGGQVYAIAPYNYLDKIPKKVKPWFDERMTDVCDLGELPGEFELTKIRVHGWQITRTEFDYAPVQMPAFRDPDTIPDTLRPELQAIPEQNHIITPDSQTTSPVTGLDPVESMPIAQLNDHTVIVPLGVYEALRLLDPGKHLYSPKEVERELRNLGEKDAAAWVKSNPIEYGLGFYNGFTTDSKPVIVLEQLIAQTPG